MLKTNNLEISETAQTVLALATLYFGPATELFLGRQTKYHLNNLEFKALKRDNLLELAKWVRISGGLLIDKTRAQELAAKIESLYYLK